MTTNGAHAACDARINVDPGFPHKCDLVKDHEGAHRVIAMNRDGIAYYLA